jgi:hypothetical protein
LMTLICFSFLVFPFLPSAFALLARLLLNKSGSAKLLFALAVATLLIGIIPQYSGVAQWQSVRLLIGWS